MEDKVTINSCRHLGQEPDFMKIWWCNLQHDDPTQAHFDCDCKNCPDFEPIEVICTSTSSEPQSGAKVTNFYRS